MSVKLKVPLPLAVALARALRALSRRARGRGGTSLPGKVLIALAPDAVQRLGARLRGERILVSATNGKTTSAAILHHILASQQIDVLRNAAGANMAGGIASTLLASASARKADVDVGLFEVDEAWLPSLVKSLRPSVILLGNLFRDQLDRYGELQGIAQRWAQALAQPPGSQAKLVLNADDPAIAALAPEGRSEGWGEALAGEAITGEAIHFGIEDETIGTRAIGHVADAKLCTRCGGQLRFDTVYLGHLGRYRCEACGLKRPAPTVFATHVRVEGVQSASFTLTLAKRDGAAPEAVAVRLPLPGLYNVYNALGAAAVAHTLGVGLDAIAAALESAKPAFGRAESMIVDGRTVQILLVKNPIGASEVLRTLALQPGCHDLLCILNDNIADGRDISWIWDADFELIGTRVRTVTCAGTRAAELALRFKYAGVETRRVKVVPNVAAALSAALADTPADARDTTLYALPTYTAMRQLRDALHRHARTQRRVRSDGVPRSREASVLPTGQAERPEDEQAETLPERHVHARRDGHAQDAPRRMLRVAVLYPSLMNIYADRGNLLVLRYRCAARKLGFELTEIGLGEQLQPDAHDLIYLGGGQDRDQALCADDLVATKGAALADAAAAGVVILGICGGYQLLGRSYQLRQDEELPGVGLLDVVTRREGERLIGNVAIEVDLSRTAGEGAGGSRGEGVACTLLAGFENHGGRTTLGPSQRPLGKVRRGHGNDGRSGYEGARSGNVIGTYLHGPLLPKNVWFADWIIATALKLSVDELAPLADEFEDAAHACALTAAGV